MFARNKTQIFRDYSQKFSIKQDFFFLHFKSQTFARGKQKF